jgi:pimeloyl-ACP methyl ester carboxylesterase
MPFLKIDDDTRIFYTIKEPLNTQTSETIIFISGWTSDHNFWVPYLPFFKDFRCVTIDNRGVGETIIPENKPIVLEEMVKDIYDLITHLNLKMVHIFGISMGGMIAQNFAIKYPHLCQKVILMNTCAQLTPKMKFMFEKFVLLEESNQGLFVDILLGHCYSNKVWNDEKLFQLFLKTCEYKKNHPQKPGSCRKQQEAINQHNTLEKIETIRNPTLIIVSKEDEMIPYELCLKLREKIHQSTIIELANEGHVPAEYEFLKQVTRFLLNN